VHQSVCVQPHWLIKGDAAGRWSVTMNLTASTALAQSRIERDQQLVAAGA
jgi:alpha-amylase